MQTDKVNPGITLDGLQNELAYLEGSVNSDIGLFKVQSANQWIEAAKNRPIPKMLFSEFWFESELCILFADTNLGKSILAVQIGDSISRGVAIPGFKIATGAQKVLYFDFELSDKQFEVRYSNDYKEHYLFSADFRRAEISADAILPEQYSNAEDYLNDSFEQVIKETGAKILIIDNLTYLKNETEKAKDALPLMKHLKALKTKYGLSILALAHTPKRDLTKPITRNDLQGSKMLISFCDSAFAIGESTADGSIRYLKQVKQRNTEAIYDADNVCVCQISKPFNFLQFEFMDSGTEREHLKQPTDTDKQNRLAEVLELKKQGLPNTEIAKKYGVSESAVRKWLKNIKD
ncbi:MAG TPA: AAA family ATPase [Bacteroidia bacterium]|nr:AAA family ATPase [Bacteroidia bacterium]